MQDSSAYAFGDLPFPPSFIGPQLIYMHPGHGSRTKFDISTRERERLLRKSIIMYIGAASDFTGSPFEVLHPSLFQCFHDLEPEITLVLSPITTTPRNDERGSNFLGMLFPFSGFIMGHLLTPLHL